MTPNPSQSSEEGLLLGGACSSLTKLRHTVKTQASGRIHSRTWPPHPAPSSSSYIHILEMVLAFDSPNFKGFVRAPFPVQSSLLLLQKMSLRSRWNHSKLQMCRAQHGPGPAAEAGCKFQTLGFVENVMPLNSWLWSI